MELEKLKCFFSEMKKIEYYTLYDLFSGYNQIHAITFSYDIQFINKIIADFEYGEIILGGSFLLRKDRKINEFLTEVLANAQEAGEAIRKYPQLAEMMKDGNLAFRTPRFVLDHRKIYLLRNDEGKTRVIKSSANMTGRAWNGDQIEHYEVDDSPYCYDEYLKDFETAWEWSEDIPFQIVAGKKSDDLIEGNAILKKTKDAGQVIVFQQPSTNEKVIMESVRYTIDHEKMKEKYQAVLSGVSTVKESGMIEVAPSSIKKMMMNIKKADQIKQLEMKTSERPYPDLTIDYDNSEARLDGELLDLSPKEDEVCNDIEELLRIFDNFNDFIGDTEALKDAHFRMLNALFASPFNAVLRCNAFLASKSTTSLPLFMLITSSSANCGKTFMVQACLKMMTGKSVKGFSRNDSSKDFIGGAQIEKKGIPIFIDEMDGKALGYIKDLIKEPESCEKSQRTNQPMFVFASNSANDPDNTLRKRMIFIRMDGELPSSVDQSAYRSRGNAIINRMGNGLYREYLRRMIPKVCELLTYMTVNDQVPDDWYPETVSISSDIIRQIVMDYRYDTPPYMRHLDWNDDYSVSSKIVLYKPIAEIKELFYRDRRSFTFSKDLVTIDLGNDKSSDRKGESWKNTLPAELKAEHRSTQSGHVLTLSRSALEKYLGYDLGAWPYRLGRRKR